MKLIEKLVSIGYELKEAQGLIMAGNVLVNEEKILIGSIKVKENDVIRIKERKTWVSRGAYKLLKAFQEFDLDVKDKKCLDIGASTGGFTEVLLKKGAKIVYSLDSGTNQLDFTIRNNDRVISLEKTNLKSVNPLMFQSKIDFICCDVSFISVKRLFDVLYNEDILDSENQIVILIKPQFEARYELVKKGGYVDKKYHNEINKNIIEYASKLNFKFISLIESPIRGNKSKNIEYLGLFRKE